MAVEIEKFQALAYKHLQLWDVIPDGEILFTHSSLLLPVDKAGEKLMIKIVDPDDDEAHAPEILKLYNGHGAVRLVEKHGNVQLLERIASKTGHQSLEQMVLAGQDDQASHIICDIIDKLHGQAKGKPLSDLYIPFPSRSEEMRRYMREGRVKAVDLPLFERGYDVSQELTAESFSSEMLLHGDLHHFNALHSEKRGWLAIDPKGIWGPRAYEYVIALCNPTLHTEIVANKSRMSRQTRIMSERSGIERKILLKFTLVHALQVAAWCLSAPDQEYWLACAHTAEGLSKAV